MSSSQNGPWEVSTVVDLVPFWKRHLLGQIRLYTGVSAQGDIGRQYCVAITWGLTTFHSALQDCATEAALNERAQVPEWWNALCQRELESPSLLQLRIRAVPISGKGLRDSALALRFFEITHHTSVDPTTVLGAPPASIMEWLRAAPE